MQPPRASVEPPGCGHLVGAMGGWAHLFKDAGGKSMSGVVFPFHPRRLLRRRRRRQVRWRQNWWPHCWHYTPTPLPLASRTTEHPWRSAHRRLKRPTAAAAEAAAAVVAAAALAALAIIAGSVRDWAACGGGGSSSGSDCSGDPSGAANDIRTCRVARGAGGRERPFWKNRKG